MKLFRNLNLSLAISSFVSIIVQLSIQSLPAQAGSSGCGSGRTGSITPNAPAGTSFKSACDRHDNCYDTLGADKGACDNQFHNDMLTACREAFPDGSLLGQTIRKPQRIACNGAADSYYQAVRSEGGKAYQDAQREASKKANQPACYNVDSRQGWQYVNFPRSYSRVVSVSGSWSVDARSYSGVGPSGHSGESASRLEPYNQYKYDKNTPFGGLLVDIPTDGYGYFWVRSGSQSLPKPISRTAMRINDADNALGDNAGTLQVCFGN
ncbi:phospholipase A2 [Microcoleus sp. ARI1-B5]|uniref:phospholipase A2 n=1 Tax=unclassified Microcoleus TaxID=2642155 RepID=UPI002FD2089D